MSDYAIASGSSVALAWSATASSDFAIVADPPEPDTTPLPLRSDANYSLNTILMDFEGANGSTSFKDWVGNSWSASGNAQLTTTTPIRGASSLLLDGTGDWITAVVPKAVGTSDFTIECEIVVNSLAADREIFAIADSGMNLNNFNIVFEVKTTGALRGSIQTGSSGGVNVDITTATSLIATSTRYHVAFVADGSTARLYIEGVQQQSGSITGTRNNQQTYCRVGHLSASPARDFNGRIDMLRVRNGECLYPSGTTFTPPTSFTTWNRLSYQSSFTTAETNNAQGVTTDGTHLWYSSSGTLYKYTKAGALVTSRSVSGDTPTDKNQINGLKYYDGRLFVCAAKFASSVGTSWVVEYDPSALTYIQHWSITGDWFIEGVDYHDGFWWAAFHATKVIAKLDTSFNVIDTYDLSLSVTGSSGGYGAGTGYDAIAWYGDHIFCNVHDIYDQDYCDAYGWDGVEFWPVARLRWPTSKAHQGISLDPTEANTLWFAERAPSGTDGIAKVLIEGIGSWTPAPIGFQHPVRDLAITTGTTPSFITWQRHIDIQTSSAFSFQSGSKFVETTGSTTSLQVWATLQRAAIVASETTLSFDTSSLTLRPFSSSAKTTTAFKGGRNYDTAIIVKGKTVAAFDGVSTADSAYSGAAYTAMSMLGSAVVNVDAAVQTTSIGAFYSLTGLASSTAIDGSSSGAFYGHPALQSEASSQGLSSAAFVSNYTYSVVNPIPVDADVVFAKTGTNSVYVLQ